MLLDTCTFLWAVSAVSRLSEVARNLIVDQANEPYFSAVSAWEICVKHKLGALVLAEPPGVFIPKYRAAHGFRELPLEELSTLQLVRLPDLHRDPFDRMLICQAIAHGLPIVTPDPLVTQYPVRTIW